MVNDVFKVVLIAYSQTLIPLCLTPVSDQCCFGKMRMSLWQASGVCFFMCVCNPVLCVYYSYGFFLNNNAKRGAGSLFRFQVDSCLDRQRFHRAHKAPRRADQKSVCFPSTTSMCVCVERVLSKWADKL